MLAELADEVVVVQNIVQCEDRANSNTDMLKHIRLHPNSPNLPPVLDGFQPINPFYFSNAIYSRQKELNVAEMLTTKVTFSTPLDKCSGGFCSNLQI